MPTIESGIHTGTNNEGIPSNKFEKGNGKLEKVGVLTEIDLQIPTTTTDHNIQDLQKIQILHRQHLSMGQNSHKPSIRSILCIKLLSANQMW